MKLLWSDNKTQDEIYEHVEMWDATNLIEDILCLKDDLVSASTWVHVDNGLPPRLNSNRWCTDSIDVDVFADGERWTDCYYDYDREHWVFP